jgi:hypothetical protein
MKFSCHKVIMADRGTHFVCQDDKKQNLGFEEGGESHVFAEESSYADSDLDEDLYTNIKYYH